MKKPIHHVKKRTLLALAGLVWIIAGINVVKMGIDSYFSIKNIPYYYIILSFVVFLAFSFMFYNMTIKHSLRIRSYEQDTKAFWHFFDIKSYAIMAFMMGTGIFLRLSGLVSLDVIAVLYTGIGSALLLSGILFLYNYIVYK